MLFWGLQINEDFALLYPQSVDKMSMVWPNLYVKLLEKAKLCKVADKSLLELMLLIKEKDLSDGN